MFRRISYLMLGLPILCLAGSLLGADAKFQLLKTYVRLPEVPAIESYTLVTDTRQITFIPPADAILQPDPQKAEVRMSFKDDYCTPKLQLSAVSHAMAAT